MIPTTFIEVMIVNLGLAIFLLASQLMWTKVSTLLEFCMDIFYELKACDKEKFFSLMLTALKNSDMIQRKTSLDKVVNLGLATFLLDSPS
jgi:hypothetical protein